MSISKALIGVFLFFIVSCSIFDDEEIWVLGFPVHGKIVVFSISHEPIGYLESPWLFKASDLTQSNNLVPLSHLDYADKYWAMDAYVEKKSITISPPPSLKLTKKWTDIPMHPAQDHPNIEGVMLRDTGKKYELSIGVDLSVSRIYSYSKN